MTISRNWTRHCGCLTRKLNNLFGFSLLTSDWVAVLMSDKRATHSLETAQLLIDCYPFEATSMATDLNSRQVTSNWVFQWFAVIIIYNCFLQKSPTWSQGLAHHWWGTASFRWATWRFYKIWWPVQIWCCVSILRQCVGILSLSQCNLLEIIF